MKQFSAKKERQKLAKITAKLAETGKGPAFERLIEDAIFMAGQLEILEQIIADQGWTQEYRHGENQSGTTVSAAATAFLSLQKSYRMTVKQLLDAVDQAEKERPANEPASNGLLDLLRAQHAREDKRATS